jgi:hypothetical protein
MDGGKGGIRTLVTLSRKHAFQACALNHSATFPQDMLRQSGRRFGDKSMSKDIWGALIAIAVRPASASSRKLESSHVGVRRPIDRAGPAYFPDGPFLC